MDIREKITNHLNSKRPRNAYDKGVLLYAGELLPRLQDSDLSLLTEAANNSGLLENYSEYELMVQRALLKDVLFWDRYSKNHSLKTPTEIAFRLYPPSKAQKLVAGEMTAWKEADLFESQAMALCRASKDIALALFFVARQD